MTVLLPCGRDGIPRGTRVFTGLLFRGMTFILFCVTARRGTTETKFRSQSSYREPSAQPDLPLKVPQPCSRRLAPQEKGRRGDESGQPPRRQRRKKAPHYDPSETRACRARPARLKGPSPIISVRMASACARHRSGGLASRQRSFPRRGERP